MKISKTAKVMTYLNSHASWETSDFGQTKEIGEALAFCENEIYKLTGLNLHRIPTRTDHAIEFLNNHFKQMKKNKP